VRLYIDSNVLIFYYITKFDVRFSTICREFLKKVESGKYEGVVSLLGLMELVKQIRELLVKSGTYDPSDWQASIRKAIEGIYSIKNVKIVEGSQNERRPFGMVSELSHSEIAWESFDIITKYHGKIKEGKNGLEHDGIHPVDALHVALAKRMGCTMIATFDRDFRETAPEVQSLLLQDDAF